MKNLHYLQQERVDKGRLQVKVVTRSNTPIQDAKITLTYTGNPSQIVEEVDTDDNGTSQTIIVDTPPIEYSMEPTEQQPYAEYTINVSANGYRPINISSINVLPTQLSLQNVTLQAEDAPGDVYENVVIPANTLYGNYPAKIPEAEVKPVSETGEIVLSKVVIPEYIVVHDGAPTDTTASDYYIRYRDYIKNVASSEIYATWPDATLRANILAIMSFTLNRVYTEWYRDRYHMGCIGLLDGKCNFERSLCKEK